MTSTCVLSRLFEAAEQTPDGLAHGMIDAPDRSLSWRGWCNASCTLAQQIRSWTSPQETVVLICADRLIYLVAFAATLLADRTLLPVSAQATEFEIRQIIERTGATCLIGSRQAMESVEDLVNRCVSIEDIRLDADDSAVAQTVRLFERNGALLLQSSGTTGLPKIVRRDLTSLDHVAANCVDAIGFGAADRVLGLLPLYHSYGIEHLLLSPLYAGSTVWHVEAFDPVVVLDVVREKQITLFPSVPFMVESLSGVEAEASSLSAVREIYSAGGPLPAVTYEAFQNRFGTRVGQLYGATEFGSITFGTPNDPTFSPLSVGQPMSGVEIRILDLDEPTPSEVLPAGTEGQVAVRSPSMLSGFVDDSAPSLTEGYFLSGDIGRLDEQGNLYLTGRLKLLVDVGGLKVNLIEVETILKRHPDVREVVVVAMPMTETQTRLKAFVEPTENCSPSVDTLRAFAKDHLSRYKVPRVFEICEQLPRSATGKVQRRELMC
jgi:long-chain acyl-CoA synthetase